MAAKTPHTGEQHCATDAALLTQQAEEPAIVPGTIQSHSANTAKPNGHSQAKGPFMTPHAWERDGQSSEPPAPEASSQDIQRVQIESLIVNWIRDFIIAWRITIIIIVLMTGGFTALHRSGLLPAGLLPSFGGSQNISDTEADAHIQSGVNNQILTAIDRMDARIGLLGAGVTHIDDKVDALGRAVSRVETVITVIAPNASAALHPPSALANGFRDEPNQQSKAAPAQPAPQPAAANPSPKPKPKKSIPQPKPASSADVAGWLAKLGD